MHGTTIKYVGTGTRTNKVKNSSRTGTRTINRKQSGSGTITGTIIDGIKVTELELEL